MENGMENACNRFAPRAATLGYVLPYLVWIAFLLVFQLADSIGLPFPRSWTAPAYALKSLLCAALLLAFRPWRQGRKGGGCSAQAAACPPGPRGGGVIPGLWAGLLVAALWILPETPFFHAICHGPCEFYHRWFVMPLGDFPRYFAPPIFPRLPEGFPSLAYSPAEAGWGMAAARLLGSAFVIAPAEEFFFRGFLYRWLRNNDFLSVPLGKFDCAAFWIVVGVFALEHDRWLMGAVAGAVYGFLALRSGSLRPAIVSHATTNLALGLYVVASGQYGFW